MTCSSGVVCGGTCCTGTAPACCFGGCADLSTDQNCGSCGQVCALQINLLKIRKMIMLVLRDALTSQANDGLGLFSLL